MPLHTIPPVFDAESEVLILGSFPSVKSRETNFFYGHPQNRFWRVLAAVYGETAVPCTTEEKITFLKVHRIALWDVLRSCEIEGSSDVSIRNAVPNDLSQIFETATIDRIFVNGATAKRYYDRCLKPIWNREAVCLPSTSPANASFSLERLIAAWQVIRKN